MSVKDVKSYMPMNLQLFGADPEDDTLLVDDEDTIVDPEPEDVEPEVDPEDTEVDPEEPADPEPAKPELDDNTDWVKRRLARAERSFERKFLDEVASESDGVQIERKELPKAAKLWNLLKHNPDVSRAVDEAIRKAGDEGKIKPLSEIRPESRISKMEAAFDLREAEMELKYSDPVYKKYSQEIKDYAEDEGLDISNPKALRLALKAWKMDNQPKLLADKGKTKATTPVDPKKRKSAALVGGRSPVKSTPIDYRKSNDADILKSMGLSLFSDE